MITRKDLEEWDACYEPYELDALRIPPQGVTPRQVAEATRVPLADRLWALARMPLPEGPDHARRAVICREAGRHGSSEICERMAILCDRVAAGESRASLDAEFEAVAVRVSTWAAQADAVRAASWAALAAGAGAEASRQRMINGILAIVESE